MSTKTIQLPALHEAQLTIQAEAKRFNVMNCGRRFGKNVLAHDATVRGLLEGKPWGWGSPTYKNLADDWRTLQEILQPIIRKINEQDRRIEIVTDGVLEMWSLDSPENIRGRAYGGFVVNEAASVRDLASVWNAIIRPTLIDLKGGAWFPSTPKGHNGFFRLYNLGRANDDEWKSWTYTSYANPYLDPAELDAMRSTMTEREYRQEILAEFLESEGQVFRNVDACCISPITSPAEHKTHVLVAGVDWGKQDDFTAISVGCATCRREVALDRFNQIDYAFQRQRLQAMLHKWTVNNTLAELNAMGEPIVEQLQRDGVRVTGFKTTLTSKQALIESFSLAIEQGLIQLLNDDAAKAELEAYERTTTETGLSKYSAPEGLHDDTVIARALMWRAMTESPRELQPTKPTYSISYQKAIRNLT